MRSITVRKAELIEKIKANMETHQTTYEAAVVQFREKQVKLLEDMLERARTNDNFDRLALSRLPVPENHLSDYRRALRMLDMEVNDEVELEEHEFNQYVLDEWEWRRSFAANTSSYLAQ